MPGESILVVDDSPTILKLVQLVLTKANYRVATAPSGEAGLAAALEDRPDLVLLDHFMPGMNGHAACKALGDDPQTRSVPVILMSAKGEEVEPRFRQLSNVVDAISKPFTPEALLTVVAHGLDRGRAGAAAPDAEAVDLGSLSLTSGAAVPVAPGPGLDDQVALGGDMAVIAVADVYRLMQDEAQTGLLHIRRDDARIQVCFREGRIDFAAAEGVPDDFLLGRFLLRAGALTPQTLANALQARQQEGPRGLLGAYLVKTGAVSAGGLQKAMSLQTSALVFESLRWGAGRFWFEPMETLPETAREAALGLAVDALLMEGFRRVDEWRLLEREIGDFDLVFVRDEDRVNAFGRGRLTREEMAVLDLCNGKNSVREITQLSHLGSFDATKMLYRLLRTKLIRRRVNPVAM
jgi:CheY-like chemotaxis protein